MDFPESLIQAILVGIMLVGRLAELDGRAERGGIAFAMRLGGFSRLLPALATDLFLVLQRTKQRICMCLMMFCRVVCIRLFTRFGYASVWVPLAFAMRLVSQRRARRETRRVERMRICALR